MVVEEERRGGIGEEKQNVGGGWCVADASVGGGNCRSLLHFSSQGPYIVNDHIGSVKHTLSDGVNLT